MHLQWILNTGVEIMLLNHFKPVQFRYKSGSIPITRKLRSIVARNTKLPKMTKAHQLDPRLI